MPCNNTILISSLYLASVPIFNGRTGLKNNENFRLKPKNVAVLSYLLVIKVPPDHKKRNYFEADFLEVCGMETLWLYSRVNAVSLPSIKYSSFNSFSRININLR